MVLHEQPRAVEVGGDHVRNEPRPPWRDVGEDHGLVAAAGAVGFEEQDAVGGGDAQDGSPHTLAAGRHVHQGAETV